jgi:poly-gamma-glutamate capsule biosynthesis protein CapA/YwtB (metallophosphatase superfamily)/GNAT superfamily N-acetyltransferase
MTTIAFLGDTLLGGTGQPLLDEHGHDYPLRRIQQLWAAADLVVANHEGPITRRTNPSDKLDTGRKRYWYRADPDSAKTLAASGIGVVSLANNHVTDFGSEGLADTLTALDDAGITHCGAGPNDRAARRPVVVEVGRMRVGFLSLMQRYQMYLDEQLYATPHQPGPAQLRPSRLAKDIGRVRDRVDVCVVLVHWGRNYRPLTDLQQHLAEQIVAAGADLVVGHHPHIPHPVDTVGGVPVLYSLGNGPLGTPGRYHSGRPPYGLVARVTVEPHRVVGLDIDCIHVDNSAVEYQPVPAPAHVTVPSMPADRRHHVGWQVMPARIVDAEVVHRIMREAYREYDAAVDPPMSGAEESVAQVEYAMRKGGAVLAWDGATPVGSARYRLSSDFVRIKRVSVLPSSRGRGIATAMLGYIERLALSQGRGQARLTLRMSLSQNLRLYERMGYQVVELKAHPRGPGVLGSLVKQLGQRP